MSNVVARISEAQGRALAIDNEEVYVNDSAAPDRYFTYIDVATRVFGSQWTPYTLSDGENSLTGKMTYDSTAGTYPINKTKRMFPR